MRRAILLLVDGLRPDVAERELAAGALPNLATMVAGGSVRRAVTAFPSTTSVSYLPFLTGCLPGRCNVPSIRWLDRTSYQGRWWRDRDAVRSYCGYQAGRLDDDIDPDIATIFQLVPESAAFFTMITRGLTPERDPAQRARQFWGALSHYVLWHQPGDDTVSRHLLGWIDRDPNWRFLFAQFPAVDGYTHQADPDHPKVHRALRAVDRTVGALQTKLQRLGLDQDTMLLMVSDHGATRVRHHLDLAQWFRGHGVSTLAHPELWERQPQVAVMVAGNGSAMVYAQPDTPRPTRWPLARLRRSGALGSPNDLVAALAREPSVAFLVGEAEDGGWTLVDSAGEATLMSSGGALSYQPRSSDPLRLGGSVSGDRDHWLAHTFDGDYPDAAVQIADQFGSSRTGDLLVVAREGFDFRDRWEIPEHRSGHGSMIRDHMQTPMWSNRNGAPLHLRTADLFASILAWLGQPAPPGIDGRGVWSPA